MEKVKELLKPRLTPQQQLREWQRRLRQECRGIERQIRDVEREEKGVQKAIKDAAKRGDMASAKIVGHDNYDDDPCAKDFPITINKSRVSIVAHIFPAPWKFNIEPVVYVVKALPEQVERTLKTRYHFVTKKFKPQCPTKMDYFMDLKQICETGLGIVSQCCLDKHVKQASAAYLTSLALKINIKVDGRNVVLKDAVEWKIPLVTDKPTITFGVDVTHRSPNLDLNVSITTVVASQDWPEVAKYVALVCAQTLG